ncbi:MAG: tRNA uridine-5-carboxymethylaminomethyl(34) synthesis GTPase MnmE, partial [Gammaproteobacteria bacterium]|nr:tRNA uridine-5-carboxymethylaminomethyl(34) synthesis GTPase MnmE [Gammaproteobacteria bacterium]
MVRISGPDTPAIARALLGSLPAPRRAELHGFRAADASLIDAGLA